MAKIAEQVAQEAAKLEDMKSRQEVKDAKDNVRFRMRARLSSEPPLSPGASCRRRLLSSAPCRSR